MTNTTNASQQPGNDYDEPAEEVEAEFDLVDDAVAPITDEDEDEEDEEDEDEDDEEGDEDQPLAKAPASSRAEPSDSDLFRQSVDGDIDELVQSGRPMVEVVGARLTNLIGARGATLEALQELSRLAVYRQTGEPSRLLLDVGGFRAARRKELIAVAKNAAEKVKQHGESVRLEPMSAFERKCVHDVINALEGVESESEGVEPSRRIVVRAVTD